MTKGAKQILLPDVYDAVVDLVAQSEGRLNFNDALLALTMQEQGLKYLLSFDQDFDTLTWIARLGALQSLQALNQAHSGDKS